MLKPQFPPKSPHTTMKYISRQVQHSADSFYSNFWQKPFFLTPLFFQYGQVWRDKRVFSRNLILHHHNRAQMILHDGITATYSGLFQLWRMHTWWVGSNYESVAWKLASSTWNHVLFMNTQKWMQCHCIFDIITSDVSHCEFRKKYNRIDLFQENMFNLW